MPKRRPLDFDVISDPPQTPEPAPKVKEPDEKEPAPICEPKEEKTGWHNETLMT